MATGCVYLIFKLQCAFLMASLKLTTLRHFESIVDFLISLNILFLSINLDLKYAEPSISKIFKNNIILISKYLNLNWNIVNKLLFFTKK